MTEIPVLEGGRIRLRAHRPDDLDAYAALWSDETVVRYIGGKALTREECWTRILRFRGMWSMLGFGFWVIENREDGRLIGEAGLMDMKREIEPPLDGTLEAGWVLLPGSHGRGLAQEAMRNVLGWADLRFPSATLSCIIARENVASLRLAVKLGFSESGHGVFRGAELVHFRRRPGGDGARPG